MESFTKRGDRIDASGGTGRIRLRANDIDDMGAIASPNEGLSSASL